MENLVEIASVFRDKKIMITGHTGFKGVWLTQMLTQLGSDVLGYSLSPNTEPNLFSLVSFPNMSQSITADIRDRIRLENVVAEYAPDLIFHLAAQPLVRESYENPIDTIETNVLGTANIINAALQLTKPATLVCITTDKCYLNTGQKKAYRETDRLGGGDPYSASKACAEIIAESMRHSFCEGGTTQKGEVNIVTARCGNVIGGGDWSVDRIVPDAIRAFSQGKKLDIRMPHATRPWIHVLDALWAYIVLAAKTHMVPKDYVGAWNFAPTPNESYSVEMLIEKLAYKWGNAEWEVVAAEGPKEENLLALSSDKARKNLDWKPMLGFEQLLDWTVAWYRDYYSQKSPHLSTSKQIDEYLAVKNLK